MSKSQLETLLKALKDRVVGKLMELLRLSAKKFLEQMNMDECDDRFLELLLCSMKREFWLSKYFGKDYYENIENFEARYVFQTAIGNIGATADFKDGDMHVRSTAETHGWTARVTFANARALRDFLFSKDQDILNALLKNEVTAEGNLNYVYKFGFMARSLLHQLHLA